MFEVDELKLADWMETAASEFEKGRGSFLVSLWSFMNFTESETMFSGQSSEEFYDAFCTMNDLVKLKEKLIKHVFKVGSVHLPPFKCFLEFRLFPQVSDELILDIDSIWKHPDLLKFPSIILVPENSDNLSSGFKTVSSFHVEYESKPLVGKNRSELCDTVFNPHPEFTLLEHFEMLKALVGYIPSLTIELKRPCE